MVSFERFHAGPNVRLSVLPHGSLEISEASIDLRREASDLIGQRFVVKSLHKNLDGERVSLSLEFRE